MTEIYATVTLALVKAAYARGESTFAKGPNLISERCV